jgi:hypothetical protein
MKAMRARAGGKMTAALSPSLARGTKEGARGFPV